MLIGNQLEYTAFYLDKQLHFRHIFYKSYQSNAFFNELSVNLTHEIGPMVEILIEDTVSAMGFAINEIPFNRVPELSTTIAEGIPDDQTRANFKKKDSGIMPKERI